MAGEADEERTTLITVLRNADFAKLWLGQLVSNMGDRFNYMALVALILYEMNRSAVEAGKIVLFMTIPILIFGPIAGVYVDRWSRKKTMIASDLSRAALVTLLPLADRLWQVYVIVFLLSTASRFFYPARSSIIPNIVERKQLLMANSISQGTFMLTTVVGPAVGAALIALIGTRNVFYLDSASFLFSALMIMRIGLEERRSTQEEGIRRIGSQMAEGLRFIRSNRGTLFVVSMFTGVMLAYGGVNVLFLVFIKEVLLMNIRGLGLLESTQGIGAVMGSIALGYMGQRIGTRKLTLGSLLVASFLFLSFTLNRVIYLSYLLMAGIGIAVTFITVPANTLLQKLVPDALRGRVFGVQGTLIEGAAVVSIAIETLLAGVLGVVPVLVWSSIALMAWSVILMSVRTFREVDEAD